jgi:hypothetical protein
MRRFGRYVETLEFVRRVRFEGGMLTAGSSIPVDERLVHRCVVRGGSRHDDIR